jgi:hypothetical protein
MRIASDDIKKRLLKLFTTIDFPDAFSRHTNLPGRRHQNQMPRI